MPLNNTIAVAMSGGVDSSTVAAMLRAEGYDLVGLTLQLWNQRRLAGKEGMPEQVTGRCCSLDDVYDARRVAEALDIPYYVVNEQERFENDVVRPFVREYLNGRTPIPCSLCNNHLKFDQLLVRARQIGADRIATGHYARNEYDPARNRWILSRPVDESKDQTYFLFGLTQEQLSRTMFPLGGYRKTEVRALAAEHGLAVAIKPDSQEICFVPGGDYKKFISAYLHEQGEEIPDTAGELVSTAGEVIGEHGGIHNFTIGQRKGLGVASPDPLYVIQIDSAIASRDSRPRCRGDHAHTACARVELDLDSCARRRDAGEGKDSPPPRACVGDDPDAGCGRSRSHLRRAAARCHPWAGRGLLRRRGSGRRRLDPLSSQ